MFRIRKESKGYVVEVMVNKWSPFGLKRVWEPYVKTAGMDCAWHHKTEESAYKNLQSEVLRDTFYNSEGLCFKTLNNILWEGIKFKNT